MRGPNYEDTEEMPIYGNSHISPNKDQHRFEEKMRYMILWLYQAGTVGATIWIKLLRSL